MALVELVVAPVKENMRAAGYDRGVPGGEELGPSINLLGSKIVSNICAQQRVKLDHFQL
jgi:hypothetical protein